MEVKKKTLQDLVDPGRNATDYQKFWVKMLSMGKMSKTSREFHRLVEDGFATKSGALTAKGKSTLRHATQIRDRR